MVLEEHTYSLAFPSSLSQAALNLPSAEHLPKHPIDPPLPTKPITTTRRTSQKA